MDNMPVVTKNLLIINVLMFVAEPVLGRYGVDMSQMFGLHFFLASDFRLWQPFTYMFMHGNLGHIFWNLFAIWMFGRILEQVWGPKRYLFYYMVCGVGAAFCQELVQFIEYVTELAPYDGVNFGGGYVLPMGDYLNMMNTVGASGAMYGILLAFGMLFPEERLFMLFIPIPIKAKYFVIGYAVIELLLGFAGRPGDTIAHFAHLGGMLFGLLLIMYWRKKKKYGQYYY
ncbi:MAG: rhomboid family intramembrane serine protease [Bacteroidaceae bacterium]|nr:rhomboid family intramembrane serine protease [Bacteroidaceae bacterium]